MRTAAALCLLVLLVAQTPTLSPLCLMAQQVAAQQQPGNPGHLPPPTGFYCETNHTDAAKRCACHKVDTHPLCEGEPTEDNAQCLVACYKDHCHCEVACVPAS